MFLLLVEAFVGMVDGERLARPGNRDLSRAKFLFEIGGPSRD